MRMMRRRVTCGPWTAGFAKQVRIGRRTRKVGHALELVEIVVDSAADESCWPKGQGDAFSTKPSKKNIILKTANGGEMGHYGEKEVTFRTGTDVDVVGLKFQVTDVKKPLLAVRRLVEKGNVVMFGPEPDQNFIQHVQTGKKIPMEKRGGAFVIKAHFVKKLKLMRVSPLAGVLDLMKERDLQTVR